MYIYIHIYIYMYIYTHMLYISTHIIFIYLYILYHGALTAWKALPPRLKVCRNPRISTAGVWGLGFQTWACEFRASGFGFWSSGLRFRVAGFEFQASGFGFRVSGFGFRVLHLSLPTWGGWLASGCATPRRSRPRPLRLRSCPLHLAPGVRRRARIQGS